MKRFQNKIAGSRYSFPVVSAVCGILWILAGLRDNTVWQAFGCIILATYLMVELNNSNALIRIYSRMVSCSFLVFTTMSASAYQSLPTAVAVLCLVGYYLAVFRCYQDNRATGWAFYAYLCIGLASIMYVQILFFLPVLWIIMASNLLAMSIKTFSASVLGILTPYWFMLAYYAATDDIGSLAAHFLALAEFGQIGGYTSLDGHKTATIAFILIAAAIGITHFLRTSSNDKIRTRMLYEIFITVDITAVIFLALQPQHYDMLLGIITVNTSPLIAHYISLTHTRLTNIVTISLIVLAITITVYNSWMPLSRFL